MSRMTSDDDTGAVERQSADALHAINQTFQLQFAQRTVDGHAADTEMLHQLCLRRHQCAWRPFAGSQTRLQVKLHLLRMGPARWLREPPSRAPRPCVGGAYAVRADSALISSVALISYGNANAGFPNLHKLV